MRLVIGLGNPGKDYAPTRHNLGKRTLEALFAKEEWQEKPKLFAEIQEKGTAQKKIIFAKTLTYMNESGKAVTSLAKFYRIKSEDILIIHDDADIMFGKMKLSFGSRSAGHKGVESIIRGLKTMNFWRLRLGIQPELGGGRIRADALILKRFSRREERKLPEILKKAHQTLAAWLEHRS